MEKKICTKCEVEKNIECFNGNRSICIECIKIYHRNYNREHYRKNNKRISENKKEYHIRNRECRNKRNLEYYYNNKEKSRKKSDEYVRKNRKKLNEKRLINIEKRKSVDKLFLLKEKIKNIIRSSFILKDLVKLKRTNEILGCSYEEFKIHLESKFESWMNWENYGKYNGELNYGWDIDHIIPLSSAKIEEDVIKLNHYTNLQPLCSKINRYIKKDNIL